MQDVRCFRIKNRYWLFVGPEKISHLWRLVENEVYDERLEFRRWYLTFAKHNACISEAGPSCICLRIGAVSNHGIEGGPSNRSGPLLSSTASVALNNPCHNRRLDCVPVRAKLTTCRSHQARR
jgi:hypothetical protein